MNMATKRLLIIVGLVICTLVLSSTSARRAGAQANNQFPTGLIAWWPADGNALDMVGSHNGTLLNGASFVAGKVGQAFSLDGVNDVIDLGSNNIIGTGTAPFTVAWWMYPTSVPNTYYFPIRLGQDKQFIVFFTRNHPGTSGDYVGAAFRGEAHQWWMPINYDSIMNHWTHVAVSYNGGDKSGPASFGIFLNGIQLMSGSVDTGGVGTNCSVNDNIIGSDGGCGSNFAFFQGLIDEVQVYNRALSPTEVQSIYKVNTTTVCVPAPSGLVSWWSWEGNGIDNGGANPATLVNNPTFTSGKVGQALQLDGTSSYARAAASASLNVGTSNGFTLDAWLKPAVVAERPSGMPLFEWNTDFTIGTHIWVSAVGLVGNLYANIYDTGGGWHQITSVPDLILPNVYQHIAVTYDRTSGVALLYLNGVAVAQQNFGVFTPQTAYDLYFGRRGVVGEPYNGQLDEVHLFNRALSAAEIQAIYNADSAGLCQTGSHTPSVTTVSVSPSPNVQGIYPGPVTITLAATASTGFTVAATHYTIDGGQTQTYTGPFVVSGDGTHTVEYWSVDNGSVTEAHTTLTLPINSLRITTESPLPSGTVGATYSAQLAAAGGTPPYQWGLAAGALPPGLNLGVSTGVISGTPNTAGTFGFTVVVTDSTTLTAKKPFGLAPPPPTGSAGTPYTMPVQIDPVPASGGTDPGTCTNYTVISGTLPAGLTLDSHTGTVSGTPTNGGTYNFTIGCLVSGGQNAGQTATKDFTITIYNPGPTITSLAPDTAIAGGGPFSLTVNGTNFVLASTVQWNGASRATTYVSATQVKATITTAEIAAVGTANVTVVNPAPGGGTSAPASFTIRPPGPPVVNVTFPTAIGQHGWFNTSPVNGIVTASSAAQITAIACTGATVSNLTGLNTPQANGTLTVAGDGVYNVICTATDSAGNNGTGPGSNNTAIVSIDTTKPTASASVTPGANANGWNNTAVVVSFSGSDSVSGIDTCSAPVTLSTEGAGQSASGTCTDKAGNGSAPTTASNINIDQTKPTLNPVVSPNPVLLGSTATVTAGATDALSGLTTQGCGNVDTSSVGSKSVLCTAADKAGNVAIATVTYAVIYNFTGFFPPVDNLPVVNVAKAGSAIPVKFSLGGNQGLAIVAAGYPVSQKITCNTSAPLSDIEQTVTAGSSSLTYDAASGQYIYVWKTDKAWAGSCRQLIVRLADGTDHKATFQFK